MSNENTPRVLMSISAAQGYAPDQISDTMTLGDLLAAVQAAAEEFGEEALVVTIDANNRYGAGFGGISQWGDTFTAADPDGDDDLDGE